MTNKAQNIQQQHSGLIQNKQQKQFINDKVQKFKQQSIKHNNTKNQYYSEEKEMTKISNKDNNMQYFIQQIGRNELSFSERISNAI